jgi:hypothetical protein
MRVSTTVDDALLTSARRLRAGLNDATLFDEALAALLARHRAAETDAAYAAYDEVPLDAPDQWGDLASFRAAAGSS